MVRARHANGGAVPNESRLENEDIACGTIYVGIRICTKYSFFVKPTVRVCSRAKEAVTSDPIQLPRPHWEKKDGTPTPQTQRSPPSSPRSIIIFEFLFPVVRLVPRKPLFPISCRVVLPYRSLRPHNNNYKFTPTF